MADYSVSQALAEGTRLLKAAGLDSARLDAALLLSKVTGLTAVKLITHDRDLLSADEAARYLALIKRRQSGEPEAYLLGRREFWSLNLKVTPAVLIPRPDTETLVEAALRLKFASFVDLGTGSGAIALALKKERPEALGSAVDISAQALKVARQNAADHGLEVEFIEGDWLTPLQGRRFDLIVSNPPYIAPDDPHLKLNGLPCEPQQALVAAEDGYAALKTIIQQAPEHLNAGGHLIVEHGSTQHDKTAELMLRRGFTAVVGFKDLAGWVRVTQGRYERKEE